MFKIVELGIDPVFQNSTASCICLICLSLASIMRFRKVMFFLRMLNMCELGIDPGIRKVLLFLYMLNSSEIIKSNTFINIRRMTNVAQDTNPAIQKVLKFRKYFDEFEILKSKLLIFR